MKVWTTAPLEDPREVPGLFRRLEEAGYDGAFTFEAKHDPFLPLALASATTSTMSLGTGVAIAFARTPMTLANTAYDLQMLTKGRFVLGLGTQVKPHIERRFGMPWSRPVARMREMVQAIRAIWDYWEGHGELRFEGEIYRHTLMIPAFNPGPNPYGPPPIWLGGFGPRMIEAAGEVADGFIAHPFNSRKSLLENVLPALQRGLATSGRARGQFTIVCATIVVTADDEAELERIKLAVKNQLAFYGSTPVYRATLDSHGFGELHVELNRLSKLGRWDDMTALISDELLETIAVVGPRASIAASIRDRLAGIADAVSLTNNRAPDPHHWADIIPALKRGQAPFSQERKKGA